MFALGRLDETLLHHLDDEVAPLQAPPFQAWADAPVSAPRLVPEILEPEPELAPEPASAQPPFPAMLELRQLAEPEADSGDDPEAWHLPPPGIHPTGSALRRRLVTAESIAELDAHRKPSLLGRIFGQK
jgi:hypothetical protein